VTVALSPAPPALPAPDVEAALEAVRAGGMRVSAARRILVEGLFAAPGPVSAAELAEGLEGLPALDLASVYRNLERLEAIGLVRHVHLGHRPGLYVLAERAAGEYLLCERCGAVRAVRPEALTEVREAIREATGFEAHFEHFPIVGRCARCAGGAQRAHP
jgi:Fur family ferric uptake transcriptional regulator